MNLTTLIILCLTLIIITSIVANAIIQVQVQKTKRNTRYKAIEQTKWIPIEENSPVPNERCGRVLVSTSNGEVTTALYSEYSKTWYIGDFCGVGGAEPIAWMPLPQVYVKEKVNGEN